MNTYVRMALVFVGPMLSSFVLMAAPEVLIGEPIEFRDDFQTDTRSEYRIVGKVEWNDGHLLLEEKSIVGKQIALAPRFQVKANFDPPAETSGPSINRFNFPFSRRLEAILRIARGNLNGVYQVQVEVFVSERDENGVANKPDLVARFRKGLQSEDSESWQIHFDYGLVGILLNGKPIGTAFVESDGERCAGAFISADLTPLRLRSIAIDGMPTQTSTEQHQAWVVCEKLRREAEALSWSQLDRWSQINQKQIEVLKEKCGPDFYSIGFKEQAVAHRHSLFGEPQQAIRHFDAAAQVLARSLGVHHPLTLEVKIQSGCQQVFDDDFADAMAKLLQDTAVMLRVAGPFGLTGRQTQENVISALRHCEWRFCQQSDFGAAFQAATRRAALCKIRWPESPNARYWVEQDHKFLNDLVNSNPVRRAELEEIARWRRYAGSTIYLESDEESETDRYQRQRASLAIHRKYLGRKHPFTLRELIHTSISEFERGEFGIAIMLCREAVSGFQEVVGIEHPAYAESLIALARIHSQTERFAEATDGFATADEIMEAASTRWDWLKANMLLERGQHRMRIGDLKGAEADLKSAGFLMVNDGRETSPDGIAAFERLAEIYQRKQNLAAAKTLLDRQAALVSARHGRDSEAYYSIVLTEAQFAVEQNVFSVANVKYTLARKLALKFYGRHSNAFRSVIEGEFIFRVRQGNRLRATKLLSEIVEFQCQRRERLFDVYSTAEQFSRSLIDQHTQNIVLRLAALGFLEPAEAYTMVLATKGAVARHQRRQAIARSNPDLLADDRFREDVERLREISQWLSDFGADPGADATRYWRLFDERLEIQRRIAAKSREIQVAEPTLTVQSIRASLKPDTVVIDYVLYFIPEDDAEQPDSETELRIAAFVYSDSDPVDLVDLGSAEEIYNQIFRHRELMVAELIAEDEAASGAARQEQQRAGIAVRKLVLDPVMKQLQRTQPPASLIVSPAGLLNICSFAALPVNNQGKFLIEQMAVSYTIAPQLLEMGARRASHRDSSKVVLVGSVDYGEPMLGQNFVFDQLPDKPEVEFVRKSYGEALGPTNVIGLLGAEADEDRFREALPEAAYVHVSTHGFCVDSAKLDSWGREASSHFVAGIALAEANSAMGQIVGLQGILWDQEIATMDWTGTELVVLSACKTALGDFQPGEGMQGLHRALSIGGATSSLTTLWNAHNDSTISLVKEFYRNLFSKRLSKAESLQQAQVEILHHYRFRPEARGKTAPCPPALWAEFVLYGEP